MPSTKMLDAALSDAKRGWAVLPLHGIKPSGKCTCGKLDCGSPGKHPRVRGGVKGSSKNPEAIKGWWEKWPDANVGIRTGLRSEIFVLDIDPRHGGDDTLDDLEREHGELPDTIESLTGGGGRHLIFDHPGGEVQNSVAKIGPGLDIRGENGYIVAPPSMHQSGHHYEWEVDHHPNDVQPAYPPRWLIEKMLFQPEAREGGRKFEIAKTINGVPEGQRENALFSAACKLRAADVPEEIASEIISGAAAHCDPPFPLESALEKVQRAYQTYDPNIEMTDSGNAEYFARHFGNDVRYDHARRKWLVWQKHWWQVDKDGEIERLARRAMFNLYQDAKKDE